MCVCECVCVCACTRVHVCLCVRACVHACACQRACVPLAQRANRPARSIGQEKRMSRLWHWSEPIALHSSMCVDITRLQSISKMIRLRTHSLREPHVMNAPREPHVRACGGVLYFSTSLLVPWRQLFFVLMAAPNMGPKSDFTFGPEFRVPQQVWDKNLFQNPDRYLVNVLGPSPGSACLSLVACLHTAKFCSRVTAFDDRLFASVNIGNDTLLCA